MSKLIDRAESHFKEVLAMGLKGPIEVPEWDAQIYYRPASTLHEESQVIELQQQGKSTEALVQTLINRALDKDGKNVFDNADRLKLMRNVDPKVILSIVTQFRADEEELEKNLGN